MNVVPAVDYHFCHSLTENSLNLGPTFYPGPVSKIFVNYILHVGPQNPENVYLEMINFWSAVMRCDENRNADNLGDGQDQSCICSLFSVSVCHDAMGEKGDRPG